MGDRLLSKAAAAGGDMGGTSVKRLCCEKVHGVAMPETPTNAGNRYAFLVACYSIFSLSRLSTLRHCGSDPVENAGV